MCSSKRMHHPLVMCYYQKCILQSFGLVKGQNVALLVDASDSNCGYGRLQLFQESLSVCYMLHTLSGCFKFVMNIFKSDYLLGCIKWQYKVITTNYIVNQELKASGKGSSTSWILSYFWQHCSAGHSDCWRKGKSALERWFYLEQWLVCLYQNWRGLVGQLTHGWQHQTFNIWRALCNTVTKWLFCLETKIAPNMLYLRNLRQFSWSMYSLVDHTMTS